ncbi:MAG: VIT1/CCC1 transporter family protein [Anaerolineales bacterium]|nr:VIT1/CCC1 transporter family protein [Chloroflexota bacterium]MBL6981530.1 VIT1/CCC1 transporter family protein [Anaerolineales bacterium]
MTYAITKQHLPKHDHDQLDHHSHRDPHRYTNSLADVILGGQDGLVNVLGIVLGVAAATSDPRIVLVAGLAATFAESVSMAAVAYTATLAETAHFESEREREYRHVRMVPAVEREEIREIYRKKGFEGELLDQIVDRITADEDVWVGVMMAEEHQLTPSSRNDALRSALIVGVAAIVGSLIPLIPFLFLPIGTSIWLSLAISALTLFIVGVYKARITVGHPGKSGVEMAAIGTVSALVGYLVGVMLKLPSTP